MKLKHVFSSLIVLTFTIIACQKEAKEELVEPVKPPTKVDSTVASAPDGSVKPTPDSTVASVPPKDTTKATTPPDTTVVPTQPDPEPVEPAKPVVPAEPSEPVAPAEPAPVKIKLRNPGFEQYFHGWTKETDYTGKYGFRAKAEAARSGKLGLNFYVAQRTHWVGAPHETPFNGKVYLTVNALADGIYIYRVYADAVGEGMYLWADGGAGEKKVSINSDINELNTLEFEVKGGVARIGFICINADGKQTYAPYFHADDVELLKK